MDIFYMHLRIMQENLCDLRKIAGWSAESLALRLGVTKQTISNLEMQKVSLSRVHYIAIRAVFECAATDQTDNPTLRIVLDLLFNVLPINYESHQNDIRTAIVTIGAASASGISGLKLYSSAVALLAPLGIPLATSAFLSTNDLSLQWLQKLLTSNSIDSNIKGGIYIEKNRNNI